LDDERRIKDIRKSEMVQSPKGEDVRLERDREVILILAPAPRDHIIDPEATPETGQKTSCIEWSWISFGRDPGTPHPPDKHR
jgi:hypothetical protein